MTAEYQNDSELSYVSFEPVVNVPQDDGRWWDKENCPGSWEDGFTARKVVFPDGQMEISVTRDKHFIGPALQRKTRAKRGESENREANDLDAGKAAKKRVRQACKTIGADRIVTLTYRENMTDRETALKHWKEFVRRLRKAQIAFHYVAVMEMQQRGAIHFHVAVHGRQNYQLLRSTWQRILGTDGQGRKMGQVNVRNPHGYGFDKDGVHKLASYIAKYCTKEMGCRDIDQKRYFCSRGIPKPEVIFWRLHSDTMIEAVNVAVAVASEGNLAGLQWWCNNALGVIWIATAPGRSSDMLTPF